MNIHMWALDEEENILENRNFVPVHNWRVDRLDFYILGRRERMY